MKAIKKTILLISLMALILFSGCSSKPELKEIKETAIFNINGSEYECELDGKNCILTTKGLIINNYKEDQGNFKN